MTDVEHGVIVVQGVTGHRPHCFCKWVGYGRRSIDIAILDGQDHHTYNGLCTSVHPQLNVICIHPALHQGSHAHPDGTGKTMHRWW